MDDGGDHKQQQQGPTVSQPATCREEGERECVGALRVVGVLLDGQGLGRAHGHHVVGRRLAQVRQHRPAAAATATTVNQQRWKGSSTRLPKQ